MAYNEQSDGLSPQLLQWEEERRYSERAMLEGFLLSGDAFTYELLPDVVEGKGLEDYVNALFVLTSEDVHDPKLEFAGWVHQDVDRHTLLYPIPTKGYLDTVRLRLRVDPPFILSDTLKPEVVAHSHPDAAIFSINDVYHFLGEDKTIHPNASILSTKIHNFLLITTSETEYLTGEEILKEYLAISEGSQALVEGVPYFELFLNTFPFSQDDNDILYTDVCLDLFSNEFIIYYARLKAVVMLAEKHKAGLYYSQKDGTYEKLTEETLPKYMEALMKEVIAYAYQLKAKQR